VSMKTEQPAETGWSHASELWPQTQRKQMTSTELSIHIQPVTKTLSVYTQSGFKGRVQASVLNSQKINPDRVKLHHTDNACLFVWLVLMESQWLMGRNMTGVKLQLKESRQTDWSRAWLPTDLQSYF